MPPRCNKSQSAVGELLWPGSRHPMPTTAMGICVRWEALIVRTLSGSPVMPSSLEQLLVNADSAGLVPLEMTGVVSLEMTGVAMALSSDTRGRARQRVEG